MHVNGNYVLFKNHTKKCFWRKTFILFYIIHIYVVACKDITTSYDVGSIDRLRSSKLSKRCIQAVYDVSERFNDRYSHNVASFQWAYFNYQSLKCSPIWVQSRSSSQRHVRMRCTMDDPCRVG